MGEVRRPRADGAALTFALLFPVAMAWLYFVELAGDAQAANPALVTAFTAGKLVQFLFPAAYVWWFDRESLMPAWPTSRGLALGVGFGLLVGVAMTALYGLWLHGSPFIEGTPGMIFQRLREFGRATPMGYLQMAIFICVLHSLFEEYYWRWFVFGRMRPYVPVGAAIAISAVGFMLHHVVILGVYFPDRFWTLAVPFSLCVAVGGAFWAWLYHRSGSLYAPWVSHALVDAAIMGVGYVMLGPLWPA